MTDNVLNMSNTVGDTIALYKVVDEFLNEPKHPAHIIITVLGNLSILKRNRSSIINHE